jgi:polysaccharide export outer membrane protein
MHRDHRHGGLRAAVIFFVFELALGCSIGQGGRAPAVPASAGAIGPAVLLSAADDRARLQALTEARSAAPGDDGYRIGPDDLLDVRIPDLLEAQPAATAGRGVPGSGEVPAVAGSPVFQQGMRVAADGQVKVPAIGLVPASGRTPAELEEEIEHRLVTAGILRTPQVSVLIAEYRSHVVAVTGSVERPGLYPLTRPGATLSDLIWAAGGASKDAGRVAQFVPTAEGSAGNRAPIRIDLDALLRPVPDTGGLPDPPARAGDVISVLPAGSVLVDGWVDKPGSYPVTRGLTVSGAIAAAGGHTFPADRRRVEVKRVVAPGDDQLFTVDLDAVARGNAPDVPVIDGDVVRLRAAPARLVPYGVWTVAREMVHVGGSVLLF